MNPVTVGRRCAATAAATVERLARRMLVRAGDGAWTGVTVVLWRTALWLTPDDDHERPWRLSALGMALEKRFDRVGRPPVLDESLRRHRAAITAAAHHPVLALCLTKTITALLNRAEQVDEAIDLARRTVALTPPEHTSRVGRLSNEDGKEAVRLAEEAVLATPAGAPARGG